MGFGSLFNKNEHLKESPGTIRVNAVLYGGHLNSM